MENNTKKRMSVKPTLEPTIAAEKPKGRRESKAIHQKPVFDYPSNDAPNTDQQMPVPIAPFQPQLYPVPGQPMYYQQPYGQPIMNNGTPGNPVQPNPYINNQVSPPLPSYVPLRFGFEAAKIVCPYCHQSSKTRIETSFNCCTCFTYIFLIILIPILIALALYSGCGAGCSAGWASSTDCDCNCNCCDGTCCVCAKTSCRCCTDYHHYCVNCGKRIGTRDSCLELCPCFSCFC